MKFYKASYAFYKYLRVAELWISNMKKSEQFIST